MSQYFWNIKIVRLVWMFRNVCNVGIRCQSFIVRPDPHSDFIIKYRISQRKQQFLIEYRIWICLTFCGKNTSVYSSWNEWIPWALLALCDIFSFTDNNSHLIVFRNHNWLINHCDSLSSFKTFYLFDPLFLIFFIILLFVLNIIFLWWMCRRFFSWANDKAWNLQIPLNLIRIFGMETADPCLIEFVIQSSVQSRQSNAILADKLI